MWQPKLLLACGAVTVVFSALPAYNYFRYADELSSLRRGGNIQAAYDQIENARASNSLAPMTLLSYVTPRTVIGSSSRDTSPLIQEDRAPYYLGVLGLAFAIFAIFVVNSRLKWLALAVSGISLAFALGDYGFVYRLLYAYFPLAQFQRIPIHMGNYINLGLIVLSCLGFHRFLQKAEPYLTFRQRICLDWALISALTVELGSLFVFVSGILFQPSVAGIPASHVAIEVRNLEKPSFDVLRGFEHDAYAERLIHSSVLLGFKAVTSKLLRPDFYVSQEGLSAVEIVKKDLGRANTVMPVQSLESVTQDFNHLRMRANATSSGTIRWNMNYHPAWSVSIDGIPAPIQGEGQVFMEINVPSGHHVVRFEYANLFERVMIYGNLMLVFLSALASLIYLSRTNPRGTPAVRS